MRRIYILLLIILIPVLYSLDNISTDFGMRYNYGILYNGEFEPGYGSIALSFDIDYKKENIIIGSGLELGVDYTGFNILLPLTLGYSLLESNHIGLNLKTSILNGLILGRPRSYYLFSTELTTELIYKFNKKYHAVFSIAPRFTTSPTYKDITLYNLLDCSVTLKMKINY